MQRACTLLLSVLLLTACTSVKKEKSGWLDPSLQKTWYAVSFGDYSKDFLAAQKAQLILSPAKTNAHQYGAYFGCNKLFFRIQQNGNTFTTEKMGSTLMACPDDKGLEQKAVTFLSQKLRWKKSGHYLTLTAPDGTQMVLLEEDWA